MISDHSEDDSGSEGMPELVVGAKGGYVTLGPVLLLTTTEPQYGRNGQYRPVISTAAPFDLRSLLLALDKYENASEIAEQCVATQLKAGVKTLEQTRAADITLRKPLGIPLDRLDGVAVLGTSPESDVIAIAKAAAANDIQDTKSLWTWEKLPYVVRCAGLASEPSDASRPKKKTRVDDEDKFVADLDEWCVRLFVPLPVLTGHPSQQQDPSQRDLPAFVVTRGEAQARQQAVEVWPAAPGGRPYRHSRGRERNRGRRWIAYCCQNCTRRTGFSSRILGPRRETRRCCLHPAVCRSIPRSMERHDRKSTPRARLEQRLRGWRARAR